MEGSDALKALCQIIFAFFFLALLSFVNIRGPLQRVASRSPCRAGCGRVIDTRMRRGTAAVGKTRRLGGADVIRGLQRCARNIDVFPERGR